jgi:hypothetical protein
MSRATYALVAGAAWRFLVRLVADVVGQLDLHRALHQALGQLREQPAEPGELLLRARAGEQLVDHLIADPLRSPPGNPGAIPNPRASSSAACCSSSVLVLPFVVLLLVVVGMAISFARAYTVPRTIPGEACGDVGPCFVGYLEPIGAVMSNEAMLGKLGKPGRMIQEEQMDGEKLITAYGGKNRAWGLTNQRLIDAKAGAFGIGDRKESTRLQDVVSIKAGNAWIRVELSNGEEWGLNYGFTGASKHKSSCAKSARHRHQRRLPLPRPPQQHPRPSPMN